MTLVEFKRQYRYNIWANQATLGSLNSAGVPEKGLRWMNHIAAAEYLWLFRMMNRGQEFAVWPDWNNEDCKRHLQELAQTWPAFLASLSEDSLKIKVEYKNTQGDHFKNEIGDILQHVLYHSAYHRGQIAAEVRARGGVPAYTDFIHAVRTGAI